MALIDKLTNIADSIREKTGKIDLLTLDQMPLEIANIKTGMELNFSVIGNQKPNNDDTIAENTIWVNTDTEITGWFFSETEPEAPVEGIIWISTGNESEIVFNALKENYIQIMPLSAKQYINGTWIEKEAEIYQNGEWKVWIDWSKWIVKGGLYKLPMVAAGVPYDPSYSKTTFTVTQKDGYILFEQTTGTGMVLWGPVELSGINSITIEGDFSGAGGANSSQFRLGVWGQFPPTQINTWEASVLLTKTGATLDVSSIQGERYVGFSVRNVGSEKVTNFYLN